METVEIHSTGVSAQVREVATGRILAAFMTAYRFLDAAQWAEGRGLVILWPDTEEGDTRA